MEKMDLEMEIKFPCFYAGTRGDGPPVYILEITEYCLFQLLSFEDQTVDRLDRYLSRLYSTFLEDALAAEKREDGAALIIDLEQLKRIPSGLPNDALENFVGRNSKAFTTFAENSWIRAVYVTNVDSKLMELFSSMIRSGKVAPNLLSGSEKVRILGRDWTEWSPELKSFLNMNQPAPISTQDAPVLAPLEAILHEDFGPEFKSKFPYSFLGHTSNGSPVFFLPFVKYDFKSVMEEGPESHAKLSRIFHQMYLRMCKEGHEGVRAKTGKGSILISDVKGLSREHFSTPFPKGMLDSYRIFDAVFRGPGLYLSIVINVTDTYVELHLKGRSFLPNTKSRFRLFHESKTDDDWMSEVEAEIQASLPKRDLTEAITGCWSPVTRY